MFPSKVAKSWIRDQWQGAMTVIIYGSEQFAKVFVIAAFQVFNVEHTWKVIYSGWSKSKNENGKRSLREQRKKTSDTPRFVCFIVYEECEK